MSDTELFWAKVAEKFGDKRTWHQLNPMEQIQIVQGINIILSVLKLS
jgi:hypothetical protein